MAIELTDIAIIENADHALIWSCDFFQERGRWPTTTVQSHCGSRNEPNTKWTNKWERGREEPVFFHFPVKTDALSYG
jgi:hypothetical protein